MKSFMRFVLLSVIFVLLNMLFAGCEKVKQEKPDIDDFWKKNIAAYPSGAIAKKGQLRVEFSRAIISDEQIKQEPPAVFSITPAVAGKTIWSMSRGLIFIPEKPLEAGATYTVKLEMQKLMEVPADVKPFTFPVSVIKQSVAVSTEELAYESLSDLSLQKLNGILFTADDEEGPAIEALLKATQEGRTLAISWMHDSDNKTHRFTVLGIRRSADQSEVVLAWDGTSIGAEQKDEIKIGVLPRGIFDLIASDAFPGDEQYALLTFSDPLDETQALEGIITAGKKDLKFSIEGNAIRVYFPRDTWGDVSIVVEPGLKNSEKKMLNERRVADVTFESLKPGIRFVGKGVIVPEKDRLTIPFEAVSLNRVTVMAMEIYYENMGQFLQVNELAGEAELERVGRYVWRKKMDLSPTPESVGRWTRYHLDVSDLFKKNPGRMFRLILSFERSDSAYRCPEGHPAPKENDGSLPNMDGGGTREHSHWDDYEEYDYYGYGYREGWWENRDNPCHDAYYSKAYNRRVTETARNFLSSNVGVIAKLGQSGDLFVTATDIRTTRALSNATVTAYNFQNRPVASGTADSDGMLVLKPKGPPFYVEVAAGGDRGFLRMSGERSLMVSHFDTAGDEVKKGIKGFIYGERGVWRPGDQIYLTFVFDDRQGSLPDDHPATLELFNPQGALTGTFRPVGASGTFRSFVLSTAAEAPTGNWTARVRLGGLAFEKKLKIEMVVPNRIKIDFDPGDKVLLQSAMPMNGKIAASWLHGAPAAELSSDVNVQLKSAATRFSKYQDYFFDDPARLFEAEPRELFSGELDGKGNISFRYDLEEGSYPPGTLDATFTTRVHERGGGFSIDRVTIPYHPYPRYVGIRPPKGDIMRNMLLTDKQHMLEIVTLDPKGKPVSVPDIEISVYKLDWRWWWDTAQDDLARYVSAMGNIADRHGKASTKNGNGQWKFEVKYPEWGRYLVRACDTEGGHCTGRIVFVDWPGWAGRAGMERSIGATMLSLSTDKTKYEVGEQGMLHIPASKQGTAMLSIENGSTVLERRWVTVGPGENKVKFTVSAAMSPNAYLHVTLLLPHASKESDAPIRLYGIVPIMVKDPGSVLAPLIEMPDEVKPNREFRLTVSERSGREMDYTIAVVDEGLLSLTRFATPDPHKEFFKKEAIGVRTWDLFDEVAGAYGAQMERLLSLGGDEAAVDKSSGKQSRFPPVVHFLGPFRLEKGARAEHVVPLGQYIGAVRVMVVAGGGGAYGSVEKFVPVREALMILPGASRLAGPAEELKVPVAIFAGKNLGTVTVRMTADPRFFDVKDGAERQVPMKVPGEKTIFFTVAVKNVAGTGHLAFDATGSGHKAGAVIDLPIIPKNPPTVEVKRVILEAGQKMSEDIEPFGIDGSNALSVEISSVPPLGLEKRLRELIRYPHGCVEQTVSAAFPQLLIPELAKIGPEEQKRIEKHVKAAITKLRSFQSSVGGFYYWPSFYYPVDSWSTSWVGHFLVEAGKRGYYVPPEMLLHWKNHQKIEANAWTGGDSSSSELIQAYRLYTLAIAGSPEPGPMNRLRAMPGLEPLPAHLLAAAYYAISQRKAGDDILTASLVKWMPPQNTKDYRYWYSYGSPLRDMGIKLLALSAAGKDKESQELVSLIAKGLASDEWYSTQTAAFSMVAVADLFLKKGGGKRLDFSIITPGEPVRSVNSERAVYMESVDQWPAKGKHMEVANSGDTRLYITLVKRGTAATTVEKERADGVRLSVDWRTPRHAPVIMDRIAQGDDLIAVVKVKNISDRKLEELALTVPMASGFEIHNPRFEEPDETEKKDEKDDEARLQIRPPRDKAAEVYQDIRDDRIYSYFDLDLNDEREFKVLVNAAFPGRYYLPAIAIEEMYDATVGASLTGKWVVIGE